MYNFIVSLGMSKWTLIRKTEAFSLSGFRKSREGCFKMKVDDRKTEGVTKFSFRKMVVKLMFTTEIEQHYKTLWRLADVIA